ncbi:(Fe-S)-binding protein [Pigmentibacter sp. JX0631]|uniref:(Fe-S)-binding protein n=1 Tax=Pigmentibacter sp. JX0631 TaxID=2976982 RepID=UPI002468CA40|nr:(Fe-S)-binding protein [Pigmentibacter sp. JX0631]WGL60778.1 (Fe-S)-binding protein [Pigmentibacter sp. JX0631]
MEDIYLYPTCSGQMFKSKHSMTEKIISILNKLNYKTHILSLPNECCGLMYTNMGFPDIAANKLNSFLTKIKNKGVLIENLSCYYEIKKQHPSCEYILNPIDFLYPKLNKLKITIKQESALLHINCSVTNANLQDKLLAIAQQCLSQVTVPTQIMCCGFAGSKGFTNEKLNKNALRNFPEQVPKDCQTGYTCLETCALGFNKQTSVYFTSIFHLLDACSEKL